MPLTIPRRRARLATLALTGAMALAACGTGDDPAGGTPSGSVPAARAATPSATPSFTPRTFTLVAQGDILLHERLWTQARTDAGTSGRVTTGPGTTGPGDMDFAPMLSVLAPVTSGAGLALCHMETPLAPPGGPYEGYPLFSSPPHVLRALTAMGYDACSTASNHTFDQGAAGVSRTLDQLDAAGIRHTGSARSPEEAAQPVLLDVATPAGPVKVGLVSFTYGFNGIPYPGGETWRGNLIDQTAILAAAHAARQVGADVVVLAMHWGTEYSQTPSEQQAQLGPALIASPDIDLVVSHHAHVVEPMQNVGGEWVAYGHGNLVAAHRTPGAANEEGIVSRFTFTEKPTGGFATTKAEVMPVLVTEQFPVRLIDVRTALDTGQYGSSSQARLQKAWDRTLAVLGSMGAFDAGLTTMTSATPPAAPAAPPAAPAAP